VQLKLGLAVHWAVYLAVNLGLLVASGGFAGSWWRLTGWGLGLTVHTLYVLAETGRLQQRLVQRELGRERVR
jgi:hypothetical protein